SLCHPVVLSSVSTATRTTRTTTLSLHDALPIFANSSVVKRRSTACWSARSARGDESLHGESVAGSRSSTTVSSSRAISMRESSSDRKSTRLNSSHVKISYAVFCLKKKNQHKGQV